MQVKDLSETIPLGVVTVVVNDSLLPALVASLARVTNILLKPNPLESVTVVPGEFVIKQPPAAVATVIEVPVGILPLN